MRGNVAGVLLAAGEGSRLGRPKALIMLGGQSLTRRGIALLRAGGAEPVIVVTGAACLSPDDSDLVDADLANAEAANTEVAGSEVAGSQIASSEVAGSAVANTGPASTITAHNPDWRTGMGSSLAVGLAAVPAECTAAVLALADQPLVGSQSVRRLIAAHAGGASLAVACYGGQPRNPVLIGREHWAEVTRLAVGDVGARPFLRAHPELVTLVDCSDTGRPDDIDTPDDLDRIERVLTDRNPFPS